MNVPKAIKYAKEYLLHPTYYPGEIQNYQLNRELLYLLCEAIDRINCKSFETTRADVIMLVESWIMAQGTKANREQPMTKK